MEKSPERSEDFEQAEDFEQSQDFEQSENFDAFKAQLDRGLETYREISGDNQEKVDIHPEQQLFFSYIDKENKIPVKKPAELAYVTEYGLVVNDTLYGFNQTYCDQLLRFEAQRFTENSANLEEFYDSLEADSLDRKNFYVEKIHKKFADKAREPFAAKKLAYEEKVHAKYHQNSVRRFARDEIKNQFPDLNLSDESALAIYDTAMSHTRRMDFISTYEYDEFRFVGKHLTKGEFEKLSKEKREELQAEKDENIAQLTAEAEAKYKASLKEFGIEDLDAYGITTKASKGFQEAQKNFILSEGYMTEDEYNEYKNYFSELKKLTDKIHDIKYEQDDPRMKTPAIYADIREAVKVEVGEKFEEEYGDDFDYPAYKKPFFSRRKNYYDSMHRSSEAIEKSGILEVFPYLRQVMRPEGAPKNEEEKVVRPVLSLEKTLKAAKKELKDRFGSEDPFGINDEMIELTRRHFELAWKFRRGEVRFGTTPEHAKEDIIRNNKRVNEEMREKTEALCYRHAAESADALGKKIAEIAFSEEDVKDAYFTPVGCFVRHNDNHCTTHTISVFDERILSAMNDNERDAWLETWQNDRDVTVENHSHPAGMVDFINGEFRAAVNQYSDALEGDAHERLENLRAQNNFDIPGLFNRNNGQINHLPTPYDIDTLSEIIPSASKYIDVVNFNAVHADEHHNMTLEGLIRSTQKTLAGLSTGRRDALPTDIVTESSGVTTLNFFPLQSIMFECNDAEKTKNVLYTCLGLSIYNRVGEKGQKEFANLLGNKANISKQSIYRNYGIQVDSPLERRRIAVRTYFVSEFNKYASGISEEPYKSYFESL